MREIKTRAGSRQRAMAGYILSSRGLPHDEFKSEMNTFDYQGYGFREIARDCLREAGQPISGNDVELFGRALSSSDFSSVVSDIANKSMEVGYEVGTSTWELIVSKRSSPNFKINTVARLSPPAQLPEVPENGEYKTLNVKEGDERYQVKTYGGLLGLSRQLLVNDDQGAFKDVGRIQGQTARLTQSRLVYSLMLANPTLSDDVQVFHSDRGNLLSGAESLLSRDSLAMAVKSMRLMSDDNGNPLSVEPKYLLVPPSLEMTAHSLCFSDSLPDQNNPAVPNLFKKIGLIPIVEPLLENPNLIGFSSTAWYVFPDPEAFPVFASVALGSEDNLAPYVASQPGWSTDDIEYKVRIDFSAAAIGSRAVKSEGV